LCFFFFFFLEIRIYESLISIVHNHTKDGGVPIILQMQQQARLLLLLRGQLLCRLQYNCMYKLQQYN
jgi:hypothetical protein